MSILHYRARYRGLVHPVKLGVLKLYLLLVPSLAVYVALSLYTPVVSSQYIELVELDKPIEVNAFKRLVPLTTDYTHATSKLQVATHRIHPEEGSVYFTSGRSVYSWIIEPSGFWNEITKSPIGLVLVYGNTYPLQVEVVLKETTWGLKNTRFR